MAEFIEARVGEFREDVKIGTLGVYNHATSVAGILSTIYCRGEICVTSFPKPIFGEGFEEGPEAVIAFRGRPSYLFPVDCWSTVSHDGTRQAGRWSWTTDYDEGWLVPAQAKVLAIYVRHDLVGYLPDLGSIRVEIFTDLAEFKRRGHLGMPTGQGCRFGTLGQIWPTR